MEVERVAVCGGGKASCVWRWRGYLFVAVERVAECGGGEGKGVWRWRG